MPRSSPIVSDYPENGWLRGYFPVMDEDIIDHEHVAHGWWKNVDFLRLKDITLNLLDPSPGRKILDLGCSDGATMIYCGLQGATVYGQDLDEAAVGRANADLKHFGIHGEARCGNAANLDFDDNSFDAAIANDFFEHITDDVKRSVFREALRVLKPGGRFVIRTPNLRYLRLSLAYKRVRTAFRFRNPFKVVIPHTPGTRDSDHIGLTTRPALSRLLVESGFGNYEYHFPPLRRFGTSYLIEVLSSEVPYLRDFLSEDLVCRTYKPISLSHFPD